jgi:hypothetical protein
MDDLARALAQLRLERDLIGAAIKSLERFAAGTPGVRRGRPPAWIRDLKGPERKPAVQPLRAMTASSADD